MPVVGRSWLLALFLVLLAVFLGNQAGELLSGHAPWLARGARLDLGPLRASMLDVIRVDLALGLHVNLLGAILGLLAGLGLRTRWRR